MDPKRIGARALVFLNCHVVEVGGFLQHVYRSVKVTLIKSELKKVVLVEAENVIEDKVGCAWPAENVLNFVDTNSEAFGIGSKGEGRLSTRRESGDDGAVPAYSLGGSCAYFAVRNEFVGAAIEYLAASLEFFADDGGDKSSDILAVRDTYRLLGVSGHSHGQIAHSASEEPVEVIALISVGAVDIPAYGLGREGTTLCGDSLRSERAPLTSQRLCERLLDLALPAFLDLVCLF